MENVVLIDDLTDYVDRAIQSVNDAVAKQRNKGLLVEMPEKIDFNVEVVFAFQVLEVRQATTGTGGDSRTQTENTEDNGTSTRTGSNVGRTASGHDSTSETTYEYTKDA